MFGFSHVSLGRLSGVHPELVEVLLQAIKVCPVDFGIPRFGGLRTTDEQKALYNSPSKTKADGVFVKSKHQRNEITGYGHAVDFFALVNNKAEWSMPYMHIVGSCIMTTAAIMRQNGEIQIQLRWGAEFGSKVLKGWDVGHIEIVALNGATVARDAYV